MVLFCKSLEEKEILDRSCLRNEYLNYKQIVIYRIFKILNTILFLGRILFKLKNCLFHSSGSVRFPGSDLWQNFMKLFNIMPVAATVANKQMLCMHGGLSPDLHELADVNKIKRPSDIPPKGLLTDLMWADPDKVFFVIQIHQ